MRTTVRAAGPIVLGVALLAGCGGADPAAGGPAGADDAAAAGAALSTTDSEFGEILVDADGMVVYVFDNDEAGSGESSCSGECLANWPPVAADSEDVVVDGVSGDVGTIERDDGTLQVTLGGLPLYLFAGDTAAGETNGQAVNDVWWVVGSDGEKITAAPAGFAY